MKNVNICLICSILWLHSENFRTSKRKLGIGWCKQSMLAWGQVLYNHSELARCFSPSANIMCVCLKPGGDSPLLKCVDGRLSWGSKVLVLLPTFAHPFSFSGVGNKLTCESARRISKETFSFKVLLSKGEGKHLGLGIWALEKICGYRLPTARSALRWAQVLCNSVPKTIYHWLSNSHSKQG